jgi:aspartate kinase
MEKVDALAVKASLHFDVTITRQLHLLTIRHYNQELLAKLVGNSRILLKQQTEETIQALLVTG